MILGDSTKVICKTSTLTHYYEVRNCDPIIHMATYTRARLNLYFSVF